MGVEADVSVGEAGIVVESLMQAGTAQTLHTDSLVRQDFHVRKVVEDANAKSAWCRRGEERAGKRGPIVSEVEGGLSVVRISDDAVVKFGFGVSQAEADNQKRAYELVDPTIARIPRVYRFFTAGQVGYIVMEYVEGKTLDSLADPTCVGRIAHALSHFAQIRGDKPGALGGGVSRGLLWSDDLEFAPASIRDIEEYYNTRQLKSQSLNLKGYPLVLCHLDVAPRNILQLEDGSICLLDWASAGFYPRLFEICTLRLNVQQHGDLNSKLLDMVENLSDEEESQALLLQRAHCKSQRFFL
ncbi:hypothetical protein SLS56_012253 [Neofusicoccum ribis]|uniref:Aminoglycoside phosphotransferase domain-containing protein n=1 Tax=Neofusicoccum ribis TaxID=45134 RepID=A0ABR3S9C1_9PEZI